MEQVLTLKMGLRPHLSPLLFPWPFLPQSSRCFRLCSFQDLIASRLRHNSMTTFFREASLPSPSLKHRPPSAKHLVFLIVYLCSLRAGPLVDPTTGKRVAPSAPHFCILHSIPPLSLSNWIWGRWQLSKWVRLSSSLCPCPVS